MISWAANLSMLFTEHPFLERFEAARRAGFENVEYLFPYEHPPEVLSDALKSSGLTQVLFNLPAGDWEAGERGVACHPDRREEFRRGVQTALEYANQLGVSRINCLLGVVPEGVPAREARQVAVENLRFASDQLAPHGITLLTEAVNTGDVPGFLISKTREAVEIIEEADRPNLRLQHDIYHMQIMEGNLIQTLHRHLGIIDHVQVADVPGRHQPGSGEINYPFVLESLARAGYRGYVSLEYVPEGDTVESLRRARLAGLDRLGLPGPPEGQR